MPERSDSTMPVTHRTVTVDELFRLPDDGSRYELVKGELRLETVVREYLSVLSGSENSR